MDHLICWLVAREMGLFFASCESRSHELRPFSNDFIWIRILNVFAIKLARAIPLNRSDTGKRNFYRWESLRRGTRKKLNFDGDNFIWICIKFVPKPLWMFVIFPPFYCGCSTLRKLYDALLLDGSTLDANEIIYRYVSITHRSKSVHHHWKIRIEVRGWFMVNYQ